MGYGFEAILGTCPGWTEAMKIELKQGDCVEILAAMKEETVGSIVCDPPYG